MNDYLALLVTLLLRRIRHFENQILLICSFACIAGHPMRFERDNACAIYCFN